MSCWVRAHFSVVVVGSVMIFAVAGCGSSQSSSIPTPAPVTPTPTSTMAVSFAVEATRIPATSPPIAARVTAVSTAIRAPAKAVVELNVRSGLPVARTLSVAGSGFPPESSVRLTWSPAGSATAYATTFTRAGTHGRFLTRFAVPSSAPGWYAVLALATGRRGQVRAWATFHVILPAHLEAKASAHGGRTWLRIRGSGFVPYSYIDLSLSPIGGERQNLGIVRIDRGGSFLVEPRRARMSPGQYGIEARNAGGSAWQDVKAYFVVLF